MTKICLFAGTTEGRRLAEFLNQQNTELTVCVATEYGESLIKSGKQLHISHKRLSAEEITKLLADESFDLVIDATHPYAEAVTENILNGCRQTGTEYKRLLRGQGELTGNAVIVPDTDAAVDFLKGRGGNILLTTGSKELHKFTAIPDFSERVFARVLPLQSSFEACDKAGLKPSHIIAMQGPFSEEMNEAMLKSVQAEWLVTKDSGDAGGFDAKISAAQKANTGLVIIGRPPQQEGMSEAELTKELCERFGFIHRAEVKIIGIGPGSPDLMTREALRAVNEADCLIGARRMLGAVMSEKKVCFEAIAPESIADYIHGHPEYRSFCVLMSGDSGFFSGTKRLLPLLTDCDTEVLPGISSLSYLCAKLRIPSEDVLTVSLHGREAGLLIPAVRTHARVFVLTGGENTVSSVCEKLLVAGIQDVTVHIGERLSYAEEKLSEGKPSELARHHFDPLSVMLIENPTPDRLVTQGLPDERSSRSSGKKGLIPMTKSEIRAVCLSKLMLTEDAVCWDIGSGTGSVSIEMARLAGKGIVYAVEQDADALKLSQENTRRFGTSNIRFIEGSAPEACENLPTPTHVFIGGASGKMREIIRLLIDRGTNIRITATAVTLESIAELSAICREFPFPETEAVMMQTARSKKAGEHSLMMGGNPVYIFTLVK